jgi:nitroreductase
MDFYQSILTRRSVRRFETTPVENELIEKLLRAAMQAPSAANAQPWHFIVITERELLEKVTEFHPNAECLHQAQVAILVCGDDRMEKRPDRWIQDCAAATQNILLAAHGHGLGAVWIGIHPESLRIDNMRKMLHLPGNIHPLSLVAVGNPARTPDPVNRFKPERVHFNQW